jgi:hypothetical protein
LLERFKPALAEAGGGVGPQLTAFLSFLGPITGGASMQAF